MHGLVVCGGGGRRRFFRPGGDGHQGQHLLDDADHVGVPGPVAADALLAVVPADQDRVLPQAEALHQGRVMAGVDDEGAQALPVLIRRLLERDLGIAARGAIVPDQQQHRNRRF